MKSFEELGLTTNLLKAITEMGYENPMPVQEEVIPYLLGEENDVIALAQTGTGKTAAFGLPILQKIEIENVYPQALVLCPTRELCLQIADDLKDYSKYMNGLWVLPVYGGSSIESQIRTLRKGVHIVVATPGRLIDLMERHCVDLSNVKNVVMDEADEMLDMGFTESIDAILAAVPENRNTLLFSATMPDAIAKISKKYMHNPHEIVIGNKNESTATVRHIYYMVQAKDKYQTLKRIVDFYPSIYGIIFCRTRKDTQEIADKLIQDGYNADALHGDLSQAQRDYVMQRFRLRNIQLLVATDVAARGLDVNDLTHIINYTLPDETEAYTHRSGRTGRAGKTGISIAIINLREKHRIREIEKVINKTFEAAKMPTGQEICVKQMFNLMDKIEKVEVNESEINDLLPQVYRKLEWLDKEDLIKRMVSLEFNRMISYYQDATEISTIDESSKKERGSDRKNRDNSDDQTGKLTTEEGYTKLFIGLGKMDGITPKNLMDLINDASESRVRVGRIDFFTRYSLFDVEEKAAKEVVRSLKSLDFLGRNVKVDFATEEQMNRGGDRGRDRNRSSRHREGGDRPYRGGDRDRSSRSGSSRDRSGYSHSDRLGYSHSDRSGSFRSDRSGYSRSDRSGYGNADGGHSSKKYADSSRSGRFDRKDRNPGSRKK